KITKGLLEAGAGQPARHRLSSALNHASLPARRRCRFLPHAKGGIGRYGKSPTVTVDKGARGAPAVCLALRVVVYSTERPCAEQPRTGACRVYPTLPSERIFDGDERFDRRFDFRPRYIGRLVARIVVDRSERKQLRSETRFLCILHERRSYRRVAAA